MSSLSWKSTLQNLEQTKQWDEAIEFMQEIIARNPDDMDAYIFMNYLLMNLIIEEYDHDQSKDPYYQALLNKYFKQSYKKYSNNAEYLYLTARTLGIAECLVGLEQKDYEAMYQKAMELEPDNLVYKETYYWELRKTEPQNEELINYAQTVLTPNSPVEQQLKTKGALGQYLLHLKKAAAQGILWSATHQDEIEKQHQATGNKYR